MRSASGMVWSCQGAPSSSSAAPTWTPGISAEASCGDSAVASPSSRPAKKPFSQTRCSAVNGALSGTMEDSGGRIGEFMARPPANMSVSAGISWRRVKAWKLSSREARLRQIGLEHALDGGRRVLRLHVAIDLAGERRVGPEAAADQDVIALDGSPSSETCTLQASSPMSPM